MVTHATLEGFPIGLSEDKESVISLMLVIIIHKWAEALFIVGLVLEPYIGNEIGIKFLPVYIGDPVIPIFNVHSYWSYDWSSCIKNS
jgi:hypothetical protein